MAKWMAAVGMVAVAGLLAAGIRWILKRKRTSYY